MNQVLLLSLQNLFQQVTARSAVSSLNRKAQLVDSCWTWYDVGFKLHAMVKTEVPENMEMAFSFSFIQCL